MSKNILIINPFGVGDVLFSIPLVYAVKELYEAPHIGYICNARTKEILETNPCINEVFVFERDEFRELWKSSKVASIKKFLGFWREIGKGRFDLVLDLSLGKEYAFMCWFIGIRERRGFDYRGRGRFLTHRIKFNGFNDKPVAEYYRDLFFEDDRKRIFKTAIFADKDDEAYVEDFLQREGIKEGDTIVAISPGGGISFGEKEKERRRWPLQNFASLADRIVKGFNIHIILLWGPGEKELAEKIMSFMKGRAIIAPPTTIRQMASLCRRCRLIICNEGGPLHIAHSQGVKTVSIFGPVDEKVYGPYPRTEDSVVLISGISCRPCYKHFKMPPCTRAQCIDDISVDRVFSAFVELKERE